MGVYMVSFYELFFLWSYIIQHVSFKQTNKTRQWGWLVNLGLLGYIPNRWLIIGVGVGVGVKWCWYKFFKLVGR